MVRDVLPFRSQYAPSSPYYCKGVNSLDELSQTLRTVLNQIQSEMRRSAPVRRVVGGIARPVIAGPVGPHHEWPARRRPYPHVLLLQGRHRPLHGGGQPGLGSGHQPETGAALDWDLEAPGLHRYFAPFLVDKELSNSRGLIDLLADFATRPSSRPEGEPRRLVPAADRTEALPLRHQFRRFPEGGRIDLLPPAARGRPTATSVTPSTGHVLRTTGRRVPPGDAQGAHAPRLRLRADRQPHRGERHRRHLHRADARCAGDSVHLNNQSIRGALAVAQSAVEARQRTYGQFSRETFRVFPVPSRADPFEVRKLQRRQAYARRLFDPLLDHLPERDHGSYWAGVEVPYNAFLNYEEVLSPLIFNPDDPKLPLASVLRLAAYVTDGDVTRYDLPLSPEQRQALLAAYEQVDQPLVAEAPAGADTTVARTAALKESPSDALLRAADTVLGQFNQSELVLARRLALRLVRLPRGQEAAGLKRLLLPVGDLPEEERSILERFVQVGVLRLLQPLEKDGTPTAEFADDVLLSRWRQLNDWALADKDFLEQRDWIQTAREQWLRADRPESLLLAAPLAEQASRLLDSHGPLFTDAEVEFIQASLKHRHSEAPDDARRTIVQSEVTAAAPPPPTSRRASLRGWARAKGWLMWLAVPLVVLSLVVLGVWFWPWPWSTNGRTDPQSTAAEPTSGQPTAADLAIGYNIAGEQSLAAGRVDEAIVNFDTALKLRPDLPEALFNRARAFERKERPDKAIADLRTGLALRPEQADAQLQLARLLAVGDKKAAIEQYRAALNLPLTPGQRQEAERALDQLNPAPNQPQVFVHINSRGDIAFAETLGMVLKSGGIQVRGIQVLAQATTADVRYANAADEDWRTRYATWCRPPWIRRASRCR